LPRNGGHDGAGNPQLHQRHGGTVVGGDGIPARGARTGGRRGFDGGEVLGSPVAPAASAAIAALAAVGGPCGLVTAGDHIATAITRTGRRPHAIVSHVGTAAGAALPAFFAVATGGSGAAARLARPPAPGPVTGSVGVVVAPRRVSALAVSRAGSVLADRRARAPLGAAGKGRRGKAAGVGVGTSGVAGAGLFLISLGVPGPRAVGHR